MSTQNTEARLGIFDGFACKGGALIAWADGDDAPFDLVDQHSEDNPERLNFGLPANSASALAIAETRVARVVDDPDDPTEYDEWIIGKITLTQERAGTRMAVECVAPIDALTEAGYVEADIDSFDGMPTLSDGVSGTTLGDLFQSKLVDNTDLQSRLPFVLAVGDIATEFASVTIDLDWTEATAAGIITAAVQAAQQKAQRAALWDLVRNGEDSYDITVRLG